MKKYLTAILLALLGLFGCGDAGDPTRPNNFTPLTSIEITSANPQIANLTSNQFHAIGIFSGLFTRDITEDVLWTSSVPGVATISNAAGTTGLAVGVTPGSTNISATLDGTTRAFALTVSNAGINSIALSPLTPTTPKGLSTQFQAVGTFFDPATSSTTTQNITADAVWTSSDLTAATIGDTLGSKGLASTVNIGSTTITATFGAVSANTLMTVSAAILNAISLSPSTPSILSLTDLQFRATGTYSDATSVDITNLVTWSSSLSTVASISNTTGTEGLASALINGATSVSANLDGISVSTTLLVTGGNLTAINVLPANSSRVILSPVLPVQMIAEGTFSNGTRDISSKVTWASSNTLVATVDSQGVVSPLRPGTTQIEAKVSLNGSTISGTTSLATTAVVYILNTLVVSPVTSDNPTITPDTSLGFTVVGSFNNGSTQDLTSAVTWTSSTAAATIDTTPPNLGVATGVSAGTTTISADFRGADTDTATLTVKAPILLSISIDTLGGSLLSGERLQLTATAQYSSDPVSVDITRDVVWTSADSFRATFYDPANAKGEIVGVDSGSVVVTATFGGMADTVTFVVP